MDSTSNVAFPPAGAAPPMRWSARPPTVLQVLPNLATGGVERGTADIAVALARAGATSIVASAGGPLVREIVRAGAEHIELPVDSKNPLRMWQNIGHLAEIVRARGVHIVHARSRAPAWSAYYAARRTGAHFVTTFHGTYNFRTPIKRAYNAIMTRGQPVIAISDFIADHIALRYGVPRERIRVIHRGVDLDVFNPERVTQERIIQLAQAWRLPEDRPVVMLPGRMTRWKGQLVLIEALARLRRDDIVCLLVGSDQGRVEYRRELDRAVESRGVSGIVRVLDHCRDMPAAYMLSDVVVSASIDPEAFGRIAAEAQAMGRPVVATDHGGSREIVLPGQTGWLVSPNDPAAMAEGIATALALDGERRHEIARAAQAHVRAYFGRERMCRATLGVYDDILRARAATA